MVLTDSCRYSTASQINLDSSADDAASIHIYPLRRLCQHVEAVMASHGRTSEVSALLLPVQRMATDPSGDICQVIPVPSQAEVATDWLGGATPGRLATGGMDRSRADTGLSLSVSGKRARRDLGLRIRGRPKRAKESVLSGWGKRGAPVTHLFIKPLQYVGNVTQANSKEVLLARG